MGFFDIFKFNFFADTSVSEKRNVKIIKDVSVVFKKILKRDSFGEQMLYDSDYIIVVPAEFHGRVIMHSVPLAKGIVKEFYKIIRKNKKRYPDCCSIVNNWSFLFVSENEGDAGDDDEPISKGSIVKVLSRIAREEEGWEEYLKDDSNASKVSINGKDSDFAKWDFNKLLLANVDVLKKGDIKIKFDPNLIGDNPSSASSSSSTQTVAAPPANEVLGTVRFEQKGEWYQFPVKTELLSIGKRKIGSNTTSKDVLSIDTDESALRENHMLLKYDPQSRIFSIALFAYARINGNDLGLSYSRENPLWHKLPRENTILCGRYAIYFKAEK